MSVCRLVVASIVALALTVVAASSTSSLFLTDAVATLQVKAPFNELFDNARDNDSYSVAGVVSYGAETGHPVTLDQVKISLRGHTSKRESECTFPKLKLKFAAPPQEGMFAGLSAVKVGTHCGESADDALSPKFGRLPNEKSPHREAFVYRLLDALQVPSLKARPARITYVYSDARPGASPDEQQPVVRNAMLLEDADDSMRRLGADQEIEATAFSNAQDQFTPADAAQLAFAEGLIGNFDWCVKFTANDTYRCDARRILWNVMALRANGRTIPLMYDFDVSGMVAGRHAWFGEVYNEAFLGSKSHAEIEVLGQVQRTRALFPRDVLDAARARFMGRKAEAYRVLHDAALDEGGRRRIQEYLDGFFRAIGSDTAFYRPVVARPNTMPYTTAEKGAVVCQERGAVPIGTAVSDPLATRGSMIQVVLLDTQWNWATPVKCPEIHKRAVWIEAAAVSKQYP